MHENHSATFQSLHWLSLFLCDIMLTQSYSKYVFLSYIMKIVFYIDIETKSE